MEIEEGASSDPVCGSVSCGETWGDVFSQAVWGEVSSSGSGAGVSVEEDWGDLAAEDVCAGAFAAGICAEVSSGRVSDKDVTALGDDVSGFMRWGVGSRTTLS